MLEHMVINLVSDDDDSLTDTTSENEYEVSRIEICLAMK